MCLTAAVITSPISKSPRSRDQGKVKLPFWWDFIPEKSPIYPDSLLVGLPVPSINRPAPGHQLSKIINIRPTGRPPAPMKYFLFQGMRPTQDFLRQFTFNLSIPHLLYN